MAKKARKPLSLYKKSLLIYTGIIILLIIALLIYVSLCLKEYDKYDLDNFIKYSVADLSNKDLVNIVDDKKLEISKYDKVKSKKEVIKAIDKSLENRKKVTYKLNDESKNEKKPIYDIYYNGKLVLTMKLANKGNMQKIKLLNYTKWEVVDVKSHIEEGLYTVKAELPEDYKLYINDKEVKESTDKDDQTLSLFAQFTDVPKFKSYDIKGLIEKPSVKVVDKDGKKVKTITKEDVITVENSYFKTDDNEVAQERLVEKFDILSFAEKYSLFLTNDLRGGYHGFSVLSPYVIQGTDMYKRIYDWAHGIDITFTSRHTLKNPTFTNEKLSNFVIYSDKAFSVDVTLEKNMTVKGEDRVMKMNDRLSFVYYDGGWKLISMESI